jgi:prepilin signal peptidase PulO-like enzyme (type II secretory pathway)
MTAVFYLFVLLLGACFGSFLNCLAWRLYHNEGLWGRSKCPKCHQQIAWYDNIPLLSYLSLGGKCRHCRKTIAAQYFIMEAAVAGLFLLAFVRYFPESGIDLLSTGNFITFNSQPLWLLLRDWLLISFLTVIFIMDLRWMVVADEISLPAIAVIFALNVYLGLSWSSLLSSAIIGAGFFALQYAVSRGRWVGGGDIRLGALLGVALGWPLTLVALMLAYFSGALAGIILIALKKKGLKSPLPFGVFLAPATLVALWWGQALWQWYANLLF